MNVMSFPVGEIHWPMRGCCEAEWQNIVPIWPAESANNAVLFEMGLTVSWIWLVRPDVPCKPTPVYKKEGDYSFTMKLENQCSFIEQHYTP